MAMSLRAIVNIFFNITVLKVNFVEIVRFFPPGQFFAFSLLRVLLAFFSVCCLQLIENYSNKSFTLTVFWSILIYCEKLK